jgi:TRAP-type C4-dicarboxylate transport system permease small subunit
VRGVLVTAVVCLAIGLGVLFAFCHGTTGIQFAYPLSGASVHIDVTTTGIPGIAGFGLTVVGGFLLIVATLIALVELMRGGGDSRPIERRQRAFEE